MEMEISILISIIKQYLKKTELTASIRYTEKLSKSGMPIYNSNVLDTVERKTITRTQAIAKCYVYNAKTITQNK